MMLRPRRLTLVVGATIGALALAACGGSDADDDPGPTTPEETSSDTPATAAGDLVGLFAIDAAVCADGEPTGGSYFRMIQSGGTLADGPFVENGDSTCGDTTYTPLLPGTDGGLSTVDYQALPDPAFDDAGGALVAAIAEPAPFFASGFGIATNPTDPQTATDVPLPMITHDGDGGLTGDLSAWAVAWNGSHFNQGAPRPDGTVAGTTTAVSGTYDPVTGAYTLAWTSEIVGGAFNGFTGVWHLEGVFTSA